MQRLLIYAISLLVVVAVVGVTVLLYNRRIERVLRALPAGAWGAPCVDPASQRAWRALTADSDGAQLVKSNGAVVRSWPWAEITAVNIGRVRIGLVKRTGVLLHLRHGSGVGLLMPSRTTLRYPTALAQQAVSELRDRLAARQA